jgi:NAD(P) transhydrogenase subunit beta
MNSTDVVIVVGANDVVNPAAENDPGSPIYGMPVLKVWDAKSTIVLKRSMRAGYAGIENELFFLPKTKMLFGDAKDTLQKLVGELKDL